MNQTFSKIRIKGVQLSKKEVYQASQVVENCSKHHNSARRYVTANKIIETLLIATVQLKKNINMMVLFLLFFFSYEHLKKNYQPKI